MEKKIRVAVNLSVLQILSKYLPENKALEAAEEVELEMYKVRQSLKETIIREFKAVVEPQFTFPGNEKLPANTIAFIDEKYDYKKIINTPVEEIEFNGVPEEYKKINE